MAFIAVTATIKQTYSNGDVGILQGTAPDQVTLVTTADTDAGTAKTSAAAAKVSTAAAKADGITLTSHNVAVTPVENAVATLEADGATPTQAHVTALRGVWDTLSAACTVHNGDANTVAASTVTADTNAGTVVTDTTTAKASTAAALAGVGADVTVVFDPAKVVTVNAMKAALKAILLQLQGSGTLTP